jgi:invasion protein IalB
MKRKFVLFSPLAIYLAFCGNVLEATNDPRAAQLQYEPWTKFCFDASKCIVGAGARGGCFPSGGSVSITTDHQARLSVDLGTTHALIGAISVQIDQEAPILIPHPECQAALFCGGNFEIDGDFIEHLKRSRAITIEAMDSTNQKFSLSFSLADFAKAYDGPESDPPKVTEKTLTTEKFKELVQQQEEERKALQCKE